MNLKNIEFIKTIIVQRRYDSSNILKVLKLNIV